MENQTQQYKSEVLNSNQKDDTFSIEIEQNYKTYPENLDVVKILSNENLDEIELAQQNFNTQNEPASISLRQKTLEWHSQKMERQKSIRDHEEGNDQKYDLQQASIQNLPFKIYFLCISLTIGGCIFLIWGLVDMFVLKEFERGLGFAILGFLMLCSGLYYDLKVYAFRTAQTEDQKQRILNDFPID